MIRRLRLGRFEWWSLESVQISVLTGAAERTPNDLEGGRLLVA
ncbi:MAG: hypothetical protein ACI8XO_000744 [Verrucomicrobiales bacterium]|jgi:hypothetical protein